MMNMTLSRRTRVAGFGLIELLITLAIISILSFIAVPSFRDQITRSRRADAKAALQMAAIWLERNQAATFRYNADPAGNTVNDATLTAMGWGQTPTSGTAYYLIQFAAAPTATGYVLKATPQGTQASADAACGTLAIDNIGQRGTLSGTSVSVNATSESCWQR